jgi:hypothetical protein
MNEIFKGLSVSDKVTSETINEDFSLELSGKFKMTKGSFSQVRTFWGKIYKMRYDGYVYFEDVDGEEFEAMLGNVPVDNVNKLKESLSNSGLTTLANNIGFSYEEFRKAAIEAMSKQKMFLLVFGKKTKCWESLPKEEQFKIELKFAIDNYDDDTLVGYHFKKRFGIEVVDGVGNIIPDAVPTKEQMIEKLETL